MNFFQNIAQTGINNVTIQIIQAENGQTTVFVTPKTTAKDEALKLLKPITLTGTPEELDFEFFQIITKPLEAAQQLFTNVESFEAQLAEAAKATADKKKDKSKTASKKEEASEEESDDSATATVEVKPAPVAKEVKVDSIKPLKEFYDSIKGQDILLHQEKIEELYGKLNQAELDKPYPKKVRLDLDIALRKQAQIQAAKDKLYGKTTETPKPEELVGATNPQDVNDAVATGKVGAEEEQSVESEAHELTQEEINEVMTVLNDDFPTEEIAEVIEEVISQPVPVTPEPTPIPAPAPAPISVPEPMPTTVIEEVPELVMIAEDYTYEQYIGAGWNDDLLVQHGKAKIIMVVKETPVAPAPAPMAVPTPSAPTGKLSYEFPKEFDAEEQE